MPRAQILPSEAPLPDWAQPGNFVFMGLGGGPLEAEKGLRSGWDGFTPDDPKGNVQAVREFYRPENIDIPITAGANWVYVIWSNGWTLERNRREQWPQATRYMQECRKRGIHVTAYISAANMFWEDYLKSKPESRQWIETGDPGYLRHYGGSLYRVMANLKLPAWRSEIKASIDAALEAGAEGFWVDNLFAWHGEPLFADFLKEMREHAARRKPDTIWHINVNSGLYHWGRAGNVVGTEDGRAPQLDPASDPPIKGNLGLLSCLAGLMEGWRSGELEHYGNDMSADVRQLTIAECWSRQVGCAWFPFDRSMRTNLHHRRPAAWKVFEAIGAYNRHQLKFSDYFRRGEPLATIGVVGYEGPSTSRRPSYHQGDFVALLDYLSAWDIQYEVLFEDRLHSDALKSFSTVVVADTQNMPSGAAQALEAWTAAGGVLVCRDGESLGTNAKGSIKLPDQAFRSNGSPALLREALRSHSSAPPMTTSGPPSVVSRAIRQQNRVVAHLVNYAMQPVGPVTVRYRGSVTRVEALVPETGAPQALTFRSEGGWTSVTVPNFRIHALVAFY